MFWSLFTHVIQRQYFDVLAQLYDITLNSFEMTVSWTNEGIFLRLFTRQFLNQSAQKRCLDDITLAYLNIGLDSLRRYEILDFA
jgi:hypothetical protein